MPIDFLADDQAEKEFGFEAEQPAERLEPFTPPPGSTIRGVPPQEQAQEDIRSEEMRHPVRQLGAGMAVLGRGLRGALADVGKVAFRPITDELYPEQAVPSAIPDLTENIQAAPNLKVSLPAQDLRPLPKAAQLVGGAAGGLIESAPKVGAVAAMQSVGIPAPIGAAAAFGTTEHGFDPVQGAIAAALPLVGRASGGVVGAVAKRLGVESATALNWMKGIAGTAGPASALLVQGEHEISKLPADQQEAARSQLWEGIAGQAALGPMGVKFERPTLPLEILPRTTLAAAAAAAEAKKGAADASRIGETTQVHGDVRPQPLEGTGQVPAEESGAGVQPQQPIPPQEKPPEAQQGRILLKSEVGQQLQAAINTIQSEDDVSNFSKRIADAQRGRAVPALEASTLRKQLRERRKALSMPILTPQEQQVLNIERKSIDTPVDVVDKPGAEGDPFARKPKAGQIAGINREKGTVEIYPEEFSAWLDEDVPQDKRQLAVRSLLAEERNHLATTPEHADTYWNTLTAAEKAIERRLYTSRWSGRADVSNTDLGFEAIRRRMQRLARMDSTETARTVGIERWGLKGLEALNDAIRGIRERLGRSGTKASREGLAILDKVQENLNAGIVALGGQPAALRPSPSADDLLKMKPEDVGGYLKQVKYSPEDAARWAAKMSPEDIQKLSEESQSLRDQTTKALSQTAQMEPGSARDAKMNEALRTSLKAQTLREVVEDYGKEPQPAALRPKKKGEQQEFLLPPETRQPQNVIRGTIVPELPQAPPAQKRPLVPGVSQIGGEAIQTGQSPREAELPLRDVSGGGGERPSATELGAKPLTPAELDRAGYSHLEQATEQALERSQSGKAAKPPSFQSYKTAMQHEFGDLQPGQLYESYSKNLYKRLLNASGPQLEAIAKSMGMRAEAVPEPRRTLKPLLESEAGSPQAKTQIQSEADTATSRERYRTGLISRIAEKLLKEAAPEAKPSRTNVSPEDLRYGTESKEPAFWDVTAQDLDNPELLAGKLTQDARRSGKDPVSVTKRLTALLDKQTGAVYLVSTYPHGRSGAMLLDPSVSNLRNHRPLPDVLRRYRPVASMLLDEPVQNFRQKFDSLGDFEQKFGTDARRAAQQSFPEPLQEGEQAVPGSWERGEPITNAEAASILDHVTSEVGRFDSVDDVKDSLRALKEDTNYQVLSGYRKLAAEIVRQNPDLSDEGVLNQLAQNIYENHSSAKGENAFDTFIRRTMAQGGPANREGATAPATPAAPQAGTARELTMPIERRPPTDVRPENIPPEAAAKLGTRPAPPVPQGRPERVTSEPAALRRWKEGEPEKSAMAAIDEFYRLNPKGKEQLERHLEVGDDIKKILDDEGWIMVSNALSQHPRNPVEYFKYRESNFGYPQKFQAAVLRVSQALENFQPSEEARSKIETWIDSQIGPKLSKAELLPPKEPGALRPIKDITDEVRAVGQGLKTIVTRSGVINDVAVVLDSAANAANNFSRQEETRIRLPSVQKPAGKIAQRLTQWERGDKQVLSAANAVVESKFSKAMLPIFKNDVRNGLLRAQQMSQSNSWRERRIGAAWERSAKELMSELNYAEAHWNDPALQSTARRVKEALDDQYTREKAAGYDLTKDPNYLPHRYDATLWNGNSVLFQEMRLWGKKWREPKTFDNHYEAIAAGPYIPVTRDSASLVGHRVRQGTTAILGQQWHVALKGITLPDGSPLAINPTLGTHSRWVSPNANYDIVELGGGQKPLAVHADYSRSLRSVLNPHSVIEEWGPSRAALHLSQTLKHTLLIGDFFHLFRMGYYGASILGKNFGWKSGWSVLDIAPRDSGEAVRRGIITPQDVAWSNEPVKFGTGTITRRALVEKFYQETGSNLGKIQDALYKDLVTDLTPTAGPLRRGFARVADPTVGSYNRFLFDRLTRGLMAESVAREFERQSKAKPNADPNALMRDISRDVNNFYGNIGRQGILKARWQQDVARLLFLAPQWVEGLVKKEAVAYSRLSGASSLTGQREGVTALGTTGRSVGRAMVFMFGLTQAINLITRGKPTWKNEEDGHKLDAWIPAWGSSKEGFWMSPLAIFNEITHDLYRMGEAKIRDGKPVLDAVTQIAANKESPITRALIVMGSGKTSTGQIITSSGGRIAEAGKAMAPLPITFGRYAQAAGHAIAPEAVPAVQPGAIQRQAAGTIGIKIEPATSGAGEMRRMAQQFMRKEGLEKESGWQQVQTDEPSYTKLRAAIRASDDAHALKILNELRKGRTDSQIIKSMKKYSVAPFTGSAKAEHLFLGSLDDRGLERYSAARDQLMEDFEKFSDWLIQQPERQQ